MSTAPKDGTPSVSFFSTLLNPGSSLHPTFLLIVDGAFASLLVMLLSLLFTTRSIHFLVLIGIELGLWASVKWVVSELKGIQIQEQMAKLEDEVTSNKKYQ